MESFDLSRLIRYIRENSGVDVLTDIPDADIEVILDIIMDYYDGNGLLDPESEIDLDENADEIAEYVSGIISKDIPDYPLLPFMKKIVEAELAYENLLLQ